ncbi:hypothetical protein EDB83DRAFT_2316222 [Lactarius deliciosus]|nr:hypothetical protein EDB83DRAFT_2316222 [Lactarius deliciosus]
MPLTIVLNTLYSSKGREREWETAERCILAHFVRMGFEKDGVEVATGGMAKTAQYYTGAILLWTLASGTASSPPITFIALTQRTRDWLRKGESGKHPRELGKHPGEFDEHTKGIRDLELTCQHHMCCEPRQPGNDKTSPMRQPRAPSRREERRRGRMIQPRQSASMANSERPNHNKLTIRNDNDNDNDDDNDDNDDNDLTDEGGDATTAG